MNYPEIERRKAYTTARVRALRGRLGDADELLGYDGCVYATGSFGRLEAGENSDLDLFIVGLNEQRQNPETKKLEATGESRVSNLNAICIKADLIRSVSDLGLPEFDGDGKYLRHYSVDDLLNTLGKSEDDASNTLTARLLLTLESRCLLGQISYEKGLGPSCREVLAGFRGSSGRVHAGLLRQRYLAPLEDILHKLRSQYA